MLGEISAALSSLTALTDIAKGLNSVQKSADINAKAVELTSVIIEVQQRLIAAGQEMESQHRKITELEKQLAEKRNLERYKRVRLPKTGVIVYELTAFALASNAVMSEPHHYICPVCIEKDGAVITMQNPITDHYLRCNVCGLVLEHSETPSLESDLHGGNIDRYVV